MNKTFFRVATSVAVMMLLGAAPVSQPAELPGAELLQKCAASWTTRADWELRAASLRKQILGPLYPWPPQTPLNPIYREKLAHEGYSVQPVAFESMPGFYCCADLYLPAPDSRDATRRASSTKYPAILRAHGHSTTGRYGNQQQCAAMARMGAVVLSISMVGYNDCQQYCLEHTKAHEPGPAVATLQLLNLIRAVDFLQTLSEVDPQSIDITGESGGGTQTFMLAAVDPRITVSIPVVMVSAAHTGCICERGPAGLVPDITDHAEIAAMHAPRPQLVISDGKDWTKNVPVLEFPYIRHVYEITGAPDAVENVHLAAEGHDYGPSKRAAAYAFFVKYHVLSGAPDENIAMDSDVALSVFNDKTPLPRTALKTPREIEQRLGGLSAQSR